MKQQNNTQTIGMAFMGMIFFIFGFVTTFNVTLADKFKAVFDLSNFEAQLVNGAFYFTYFLLSFACGGIIKKIGYKSGVILGLVLVAAGSFLFYPAAKATLFPFFLFAIFVLASGVVFLQVAANPYVAALGPSDTASGRLNLTQALNSIATTLAPILASVFVFKEAAGGALDAALSREEVAYQAAQSVPVPFLIIGVLVLIIAVVIFFLKLPVISTEGDYRKSVWKYPHVLLGAVAIFCYVGAEVGNAAMIQRYLQEAVNFTKIDAAKMIALYWGGAMIGRFYASFMLSNVDKAKRYLYSAFVMVLAFLVGWYVRGVVTDGLVFLGIAFANYLAMLAGRGKTSNTLAVFAIVAAILGLSVMLMPSQLILWVGCSIGFFNSVMFPNIFALSVDGLDKGELSMASGIINSMIMGGAVISVLMGVIADSFAVKYSFILPVLCYGYIAYFALKGSRHK